MRCAVTDAVRFAERGAVHAHIRRARAAGPCRHRPSAATPRRDQRPLHCCLPGANPHVLLPRSPRGPAQLMNDSEECVEDVNAQLDKLCASLCCACALRGRGADSLRAVSCAEGTTSACAWLTSTSPRRARCVLRRLDALGLLLTLGLRAGPLRRLPRRSRGSCKGALHPRRVLLADIGSPCRAGMQRGPRAAWCAPTPPALRSPCALTHCRRCRRWRTILSRTLWRSQRSTGALQA